MLRNGVKCPEFLGPLLTPNGLTSSAKLGTITHYYYKVYWLEWRCYRITVAGVLNNEKEKLSPQSVLYVKRQWKQRCLQFPAKQLQWWRSPDRRRQAVPGACSRYWKGAVAKCDASRWRHDQCRRPYWKEACFYGSDTPHPKGWGAASPKILKPLLVYYANKVWLRATKFSTEDKWRTGVFLVVSHAPPPILRKRRTSVSRISWDPLHARTRYEKE